MSAERRALFGLTMLASILVGVPARAQDAPQTCEVPPYLLATESSLPKVAAAIKAGQKLDILVVGSRSSTINSAEAMAYPGRLEAMLREKLAPVQVSVALELQVKKTAEEVAAGLPQMGGRGKTAFVGWENGQGGGFRVDGPGC